ncbi:MAG: hypothetical protein BWY77_01716 [bacterium ADurb.Bin431]|nr:MAG: hypothetical protein BWY77_01716 [bacterium ADurb.Bin431]
MKAVGISGIDPDVGRPGAHSDLGRPGDDGGIIDQLCLHLDGARASSSLAGDGRRAAGALLHGGEQGITLIGQEHLSAPRAITEHEADAQWLWKGFAVEAESSRSDHALVIEAGACDPDIIAINTQLQRGGHTVDQIDQRGVGPLMEFGDDLDAPCGCGAAPEGGGCFAVAAGGGGSGHHTLRAAKLDLRTGDGSVVRREQRCRQGQGADTVGCEFRPLGVQREPGRLKADHQGAAEEVPVFGNKRIGTGQGWRGDGDYGITLVIGPFILNQSKDFTPHQDLRAGNSLSAAAFPHGDAELGGADAICAQ